MKRQLLAVLIGTLIGAVPAAAATLVVTNANDSGPGSLRDALAAAAPGDEIRFDASLAGVPIILTTGELRIERDVTITGLGQAQSILDGNRSIRLIHVARNASVALSGITIRNGWAYSSWEGDGRPGAGILNSGNLVLDKVTISGNHCGSYASGCGIGSDGVLTLRDSLVEQNEGFLSSYAGGIWSIGPLTIENTVIQNNYTADCGGIAAAPATAISRSLLYHNVAYPGHGGGLCIGGNTTITDTQILSNPGNGGGGIVNSGNLVLRHSIVAFNRASHYGAGGVENGGSMTVEDSEIRGNSGDGQGGVENFGNAQFVRTTISGNTSGSSSRYFSGGGLRNEGACAIINSTISGNRSGGVVSEGWLELSNVTITQNTGRGELAGGITLYSTSRSSAVVRNSVISGNWLGDGASASSDCSGSIVSLGNNLMADGNGCAGFVGSDLVGIDADTVLEPALSDNGGSTPTLALLPESPAIDRIPLSECLDTQGHSVAADQRGVSRPQGAACDIGAFEFSWPRGAGFWAHQCGDKGFHQVGPEEMEALFTKIAEDSSAFPECAPIGCDVLDPTVPKNDIRARAQQALLDVWLNLVSGRLTRGRPIDLPDLTSATKVGDAVSQLEVTVCDPEATRSELGNAKDLAEALNGSSEDLELAAPESAATLQPGATATFTLGLINLSPGTRNYSLWASGSWPVQLSAARVNALGSGQVAPIVVTVTAPRDGNATAGRIRVVATDFPGSGTLSRELVLTLRLAGTAPPDPALLQRPRVAD